jgi:acyl transferase domain-containing protein/SAM-dependent methyltransferase
VQEENSTEIPAIAVVGMAGRFPGAGSVAELWENLRQGVESISFFPPAAGPADPKDPRHVPAAGVLSGADLFDAPLFGLTPREAELLDPQHRVFLECAWEALEDAGYDPARPIGETGGPIGVFGGASLNSYLLWNLLPSGAFGGPGGNAQAAIASDKDFLTTRVSYKLDLKGPSLDVQTACSTSLVAIVLACQSLLNFGCDLALAGGVSVREPQDAGYLYEENGILSPDGHCRPFDARAQGTVPGNGVGIVVLKRLEDARADGDSIRAVIRGAALNNDGAAKVGFTAPSVAGQAEVVGMALAIAGVRPREVTYVEAHGTATPMGDPIEVRALDRVFREDTDERGFCTLGSIKSNLGHLDAAAGVAGFIKTVLALEHREIPPTLHFERPNPELDLESGPFRVSAELRPWETDRLPRRAGVSSFGIGGTNAHVVLEEAPERGEERDGDREAGPELLLLSARTPEALEAMTARLAAHLERHPEIPLEDVAFTLRRGRRQLGVRRAMIGDRVWTAEVPPGERSVAFLFPGQGAQQAGMAGNLYRREPAFRREIDACSEYLDFDLRRLVDPPPGSEEEAAERLAGTAVAQPALFAVEYALARLWISWGVRPAAMLGHSLGELTAACLAGVLPLPEALALVALRGRLMQSLPPGSMLAVSLPEAELASFLEGEIELAAVNAPGRTVATGPPGAVADLAARLAALGVESRALPVRHAFHSRAVEPILGPWVEALGRVRLEPPQIPFLSNRTGTWITPAQATDPAYWGEHLRHTVRFSAGLAELLADPNRVLLEVGPGHTLAALARRQAGPEERVVLSSLAAPLDVLGALGEIWTAGVEIDWAAFRPGRGRRVPLPTYPFERQRYWIEGVRREEEEEARDRLWVPLWKESLPPRPTPDTGAVWLVFGGGGVVERLRAERREAVVAVAGPAGTGLSRVSEGAYTLDPEDPAGYDALLAAIPLLPDRQLRAVYLWSGAQGLAHLGDAIRRLPDPGRVRIDLVTAGAVDPTGEQTSDPEKARVLEVCEGLAAGSPPLSCRAVDLLLEGTGEREERRRADRLLAELDAPGAPGSLVAWRGRRRWVQTWEELPGDWFHDLPLPQPTPSQGEETAAEDREIDALCTRHVLRCLGESGVEVTPGRAYFLPELRRRLRLVPRHERLFESLLRMLAEDGLAAITGEEVRFLAAAGTAAETGPPPRLAPLVELLDHCARHLPQVLAGEMEGLAVLYPEGSPELLRAAVARADSVGQEDLASRLLSEVLSRAAALPRTGPLRILEVGAGQGLLTRKLLPALVDLGGAGPVEYTFTDLGRAFVLRAEQELTPTSSLTLAFRVLDISRDPEPQGFPRHRYDAVVGADVVHATPRIAETLGHLHSLLAPGGLLGLIETVRRPRWGDLVWGLTDGWWAFADTDLRTTSPLLPPDTWERVLGEAGFVEPRAWARDSASALLLAHARREAPAMGRPERPAAPAPSAVLHDRPRLQNPYVAPRDETERAVAEIWRRALGVDRIGVDDNFLELGGDSLIALSVTHAIRREFDLGGRSFSLFESPTVAAIARFVRDGREERAETPEITDFDLRASRGERRRERRGGRRSTR